MNTPGHLVPGLAGTALAGRRVVDLSHTVTDGLPVFPADPELFEARTFARIEDAGYLARSFRILEHYGTHVDAPAHLLPDGLTVDEIPVARLLGPAVILDVQKAVAADADYALPPARIADWEAACGRIPQGAIVLLRTGWASRWPDAAAYRNQDASGVMHFPGFSADAARLLIDRGASALGCDAMSVDPGRSRDYPVHRLALAAGLYFIENLSDLSALPATGTLLVVAPIKLQGGSGASCRVFALLP